MGCKSEKTVPRKYKQLRQLPVCRKVKNKEKSGFHEVRIMVREVRWTKYLWLSLLSFGAFMLEYLSIFVIEATFLHIDIQNYTMQQRSIHCIIMVFMWAFFIGVLLLFSRKHYHFPERGSKRDKISSKSWIVTLACFFGCKIMTFID